MNPLTLRVYAITAVVTAMSLMLLWAYSGVTRVRSKTVLNPEDAATVARGAALLTADPPEVARVLRAHANAMAIAVPFLALGLVFVLLGGAPGVATALCATFVLARLLHATTYLRKLQPWRTLSFVVSALCTLALCANDVWLLAHG